MVQFFMQLAMQFYSWEMQNWQIHVSITVCQYIFNIPNIFHKFTSLKSRIALQVARKIAPCDRTFSDIRAKRLCSVSKKKGHCDE